jgi:WD40 repeat protein
MPMEIDCLSFFRRTLCIAVAVSKNATRLITEACGGEVILWSLPDQKKIRVLGESWRGGRPVRFSPNGELIALGGMDKIAILSSERGETLREIGPHGHYIMALAFSPDGKMIASGTRNSIPKSVAVFDVDTGKLLFEFDGHTNGITGVAFSHDATRLVSTSGDGTLRFLHLPSGIELLSLKVGGSFGDAHFSSDGRTLLWSGDRGLELIQLQHSVHAATGP